MAMKATPRMSPAMQHAAAAFTAFAERYGPAAGAEGPVLFVREVLGVEPDDWQLGVLLEFGRGERRISARSCHGPGKTALLAWLVLIMLMTRYPQKTVATAPSKGQLEDALVSEVLHWFHKLPPVLQNLFETKKNRIELKASPESSFFSARTAREENPEALQGIHSDNVLLIADEASGVPEAIFEAAVGSMSGHNATTILASNPVRTTGFFYRTHMDPNMAGSWKTHHVSAFDTPRVSCAFVTEVAEAFGEDSNAYRIRVLGEFPNSDLDTIIPMELIIAAQGRDIKIPPRALRVWGLDVARFGDDRNVLMSRSRLGLDPTIRVWVGMDLMETAGKVKHLWDETDPEDRPDDILVDAIGMGAGVVDRLREMGLPARAINVSETKAVDSVKYRNLRTQLWFMARDWLDTRDHYMPDPLVMAGEQRKLHTELAAEMAGLKYKFTSSGAMHAEPKSDYKKRNRRSPDLADAFVLTFAGEPATLVRGSSGRSTWASNWSKPLSRDIEIV